MFVIWLNYERDGAMEYYTINDIKILTGYNEKQIRLIIKKLNDEVLEKYKNNKIKPLLFVDKIEKNYFLKRMEIELWKKC